MSDWKIFYRDKHSRDAQSFHPSKEAATRAFCAWAESDGDSRIGEILIQPAGWAEASRRWQSRIRKICATG